MHFVLAKLINSRDMGYIISTLTSIYIILLLLLVFLICLKNFIYYLFGKLLVTTTSAI